MTCPKDLLDYGMVEMQTPLGHTVRTYDIHRTMIDILRKARYLHPGVLETAEQAYYNSNECSPETLLAYADHFRATKRAQDSLRRNGRL